MIENNRPRGALVNIHPFRVSRTGKLGKYPKVTLSLLTNIKSGDLVYQEIMENGIVLIIPEKLYLATKTIK
jgi:hypothetical protein